MFFETENINWNWGKSKDINLDIDQSNYETFKKVDICHSWFVSSYRSYYSDNDVL